MKNLLVCALLFTVCSGPQQTAPSLPATTPGPVPVPISLKQVVEAFNAANLPIGRSVIYNERTDPNELLGRPGRYVEKMNFTDKRIKGNGKSDLKELKDTDLNCSIEIFKNPEDAQNRHQYLENLGRPAAMFDSYKFLHKNILVRIDLKLIPSEADEYKRILGSL